MPIYEYKCIECGQHLEKMQKVSDAPLTVCESCGGKLEKQISLSGFQFKGEGWYVTDYSKKSGPTPEKSKKSESAESTAKSDSASNSSSDSSPAPAKDTTAKKD